MCFPSDAVPPDVPRHLLVGDPDSLRPETVTLESGDGTAFRAAFTAAPEARGAAVVVLPDVRGLFAYYRNLTAAFAAAGHHAIAIDYFGRTAGADERPADFDFLPHLQQTRPELVRADLRAALAHLQDSTGATAFCSVGFCFGGSHSYLATTDADLPLAGAVSFYGGLDPKLKIFPRPAAEAHRMRGPLLALYGGADPSITPALREEFDAALTSGSVDHDFVVYPGAPHSFFDRSHGDFAAECDDAWRRVIGFLRDVA